MENITLHSSDVILCEKESHPDSYFAKFIICDFSRNENGVAIDRYTAENWISTLKNKPLVGKIKMKLDGTYDFTGHNMKKVVKTDGDGNKYTTVEFDTSAFGSFTDIYIEEIDDTEYIVAECEIWKRFTKACEIILTRIENSTLHTSWEISVEKSKKKIVNGLMTKVIEAGRFLGHCLLAADVQPAYDCSGMLEIASTNYDDLELSNALSQDLVSQGLDIKNEIKEENMGKTQELTEGKIVGTELSEEGAKNENIDNECSTLTSRDLRKKIADECRKTYRWFWISHVFPTEDYVIGKTGEDDENDLDYVKFSYSVSADGVVTVGEPEKITLVVSITEINTKIAEKDDAILKANQEIQSLMAENESLQSYKKRCQKEDADKAEAEISEKKEKLRQYALSSNQITEAELESEEFKTIISELNETKMKSIIADRVVESISKKDNIKTETSEIEISETPKANINTSDDVYDYRTVINSYLGR